MISEIGWLSRWDVAVTLFPFTDAEIRKARPVLVLTQQDFHASHGHAIVAMITTASRSSWPSDYPILDLEAAGLKKASVVRWKLFTLPLSNIPRRAGSLGGSDRGLLAARLAGIMLG